MKKIFLVLALLASALLFPESNKVCDIEYPPQLKYEHVYLDEYLFTSAELPQYDANDNWIDPNCFEHHLIVTEAKKSLSEFIKSCINNDIRCILVITGKKKTLNGAKGLIRENLPLWLKEHELFNYILYHCYATKKDGDDGARYILLRKKDKVLYG